LHEHDWQFRSVEYEDGLCVRRLECVVCDAVHFE
jgi:hypothetical protein